MSSVDSRSMRAARIDWTVVGTWIAVASWPSRYAPRSPTSTFVSTSACTLSSMNKGLPSVRAMRVRLSASRLAAVPSRPVRRSSTLSAGSGSMRSCR